MKNPITRIALAASIVVACLLGSLMLHKTGSIALADVLNRIEMVSAYIYQMNMTMTHQIDSNTPKTSDMVCTAYISKDHGMKTVMENTDRDTHVTTVQEMYMLPEQKVIISIMPEQKMYTRMEYDETLLERMRKQNNDPKSMVEMFLKGNYTSLGKSKIDGLAVEGFQTTDGSAMGGMFGDSFSVTMWVDQKTGFPVRSEMEMDMDMGEKMHMKGTTHNYEWDVSVEASQFEPIIPEDYKNALGSDIKMPAMNEENMIKGLTLHAELLGNYPEKTDMMSIMSCMKDITKGDTPVAKTLRESAKKGNKEEAIKSLTDTMMTIQSISTFYMTLVADDKEPAYYGKKVTPNDPGLVLIRWKESDDQYRVIFGDLRAETVSKAELAELEADLPQ